MGGFPCYITIDQNGKVILKTITDKCIKEEYESFKERHENAVSDFEDYYDSYTKNNPYYYKVEYQIDKTLVEELNKTVKDNFLAFFQSAKPNRRIMDGRCSTIYVKLSNGSEYENGDYEPQNKKFNIIENKIMECITAEDGKEKFDDFRRKIDEIFCE